MPTGWWALLCTSLGELELAHPWETITETWAAGLPPTLFGLVNTVGSIGAFVAGPGWLLKQHYDWQGLSSASPYAYLVVPLLACSSTAHSAGVREAVGRINQSVLQGGLLGSRLPVCTLQRSSLALLVGQPMPIVHIPQLAASSEPARRLARAPRVQCPACTPLPRPSRRESRSPPCRCQSSPRRQTADDGGCGSGQPATGFPVRQEAATHYRLLRKVEQVASWLRWRDSDVLVQLCLSVLF